MNIIVKNYEHLNRSLPNWNTPKGVYVKNKDHYDRLMKESGMVSYEKMQDQASQKKTKDYSMSKEGLEIIKTVKNSADRRGNVKLSDRTIDAMVKKGIIKAKS